MENYSPRKPRVRRAKSGFTLLEVMFAIIVMNILVTVTARQILTQNELVTNMEEWCADDPVLYVDPAADPVFRAMEVSPELIKTAPVGGWIKKSADPLAVRINAVKQDLKKFKAKAELIQIASCSGDDDDDGDDD